MRLFSKLFGQSAADSDGPAPPLTPEQFADHYLTILARNAPGLTAERIAADVRLQWADGGTMTQFMGNAYTQYRNDPDALDAVLEAQLASARAAAAPQQPLNLNFVLPLVKPRSWLATASAQTGDAIDFLTRPLVSDLIIVFAQDLPDTITYVKDKDLEGVCEEAELVSRAMANLAARVPALEPVGGDGRYRIELDGFFDASLILVASDWLQPLALEGDPVFAIPCRDQLMVCGSANSEAVTELEEIAPMIASKEAYAISGELLTLRNGALQPL
jgi:hypothetical protein